jgi:hypothetical protein
MNLWLDAISRTRSCALRLLISIRICGVEIFKDGHDSKEHCVKATRTLAFSCAVFGDLSWTPSRALARVE